MALPRPSHYEILGIADTADKATIKKAAYRQLLRWHPDKYLTQSWITLGDLDVCEEIAKRLTDASGVLLDDEKRREYDALRRQGAATEGQAFYDKWKELQERMDFYSQHQAILERFLTPLFREKGELKQKLKQSEDTLGNTERTILSLQRDKADLSEQKDEAQRQSRHHVAALKNAEFLQATQEKELESSVEQTKQQEKQLKELTDKLRQQETQIKQLSEALATKMASTQPTPSSAQPKPPTVTAPTQPTITAPAPTLFQPAATTPTTGKFVCPGLVGIKILVNPKIREASVYGVELLLSDMKSVDDLRRLFESQKPYPIYKVANGQETSSWAQVGFLDGKDKYVHDFRFARNSTVYFESLDSKRVFEGYILLREFEKYVDTTDIPKVYWDWDTSQCISEIDLPEILKPSAFYEKDKTPQPGKM